MLKASLIFVCLSTCAYALPVFSGVVVDALSAPIDGAGITVWDASTGKGVKTDSSMGEFSVDGLPDGDYLFKVEKDSQLPVFGGFHLLSDQPHRVKVVMQGAVPRNLGSTGAGAPLRDSVRPPRSSATPPKVKPAELKRKVDPSYPEAARKAGIGGLVKIAMVILPDGTVNDLVALSAPNTDLAVAAILAVKQWQYSPTYLDNVPVEASLTVNVTFQR